MNDRTYRSNVSVLTIAAMCLWSASAFAQVADPSTMNGKVMPGYQGWFYCPGDGNPSGVGWRHWSRSTTSIGPNLYTTDLWPDISEYSSVFAASGTTLLDGSPGFLFSSITPSTVTKHFEWMKTYGIDGVLVQRFLSELGDPTFFALRNTVLQNVRSAASTHGRTFALEYDISGAAESTLYQNLTNDWIYLSNTYNLRNDPRYQYHNGKPVIVIWGLGFSDRPGTPAIANQIINFFKNDPTYGNCFCVGGVPGGWRNLSGSSKTDPAWASTYRSWHCINPWTVGAYKTSADITNWKNSTAGPDVTECNNLGIVYLPVVWPGFSWDNLMQLPPGTSLFDRRNGQHFWDQAFAYESLSGVNKLFVAMFDECDEGTAIFKIADNVPNTNHWVGNNGYPKDWWMRLAGSAGQMARGEIPLSGTIPISPFSCLSGDVSIDLGSPDVADLMTHPQPQGGDGNTTPVTIGGRTCRQNVNPASDFYFYFGVDDSFSFQGSCPDVYIKMDYYDTGTGTLQLQYDATSTPYKSGPSVTLANTNTWKTTTFHVTDAYFGNRQNGGMDFRIAMPVGVTRYLDIVRVAEKGPVSIFTATPGSGAPPLAVSFNGTSSYDTDGTISSYAWVFGDGGTGSGSTINHTYTAGGNYTAKLTVTDNSGNTDFATMPISVSTPDVVFINVGSPDVADRMTHPQPGDGNTTANTVGGRTGKKNVNVNADYYFYFGVDDTYAFQGSKPNVYITFSYYDSGTGSLSLQYDATSSAYKSGPGVTLTNTNTWKQATLNITDAYFGNRQNNGADFRIFLGTGVTRTLDLVQVTTSATLPGFAVTDDLGSPDVPNGLTHPICCDGNTTPATIGGRTGRQNVNPNADFYFYFAAADTFAYQGSRPDLYISIDYFDSGTGSLSLQYDGANNAYTSGSTSITLTNTNTWKTGQFHVTDAYFANRQNGGADFRIALPVGVTRYLDVVRVSTTP